MPTVVPVYVVAGVVGALVLGAVLSRRSKLDAIPTVGSSGWLGSWWASLTYLTNATVVIQKGYDEHKSAPFKVAAFNRWLVVFGSREHVEELQRAPADTLSFAEVLKEQIHVEYTMGPEIHHNPYHTSIVRSQLTRNIGALYPEMRDEIVTSFDEVLDLKGNEWKSVQVLSNTQKIVCRTSNRVFVGLPLCRNQDWIDLSVHYATDIVAKSLIIALSPKFLKPAVAWMFLNIDSFNRRARKLLGPIIEFRRKSLNEYEHEWPDKPNDLLSWLMDEAEGPESTIKSLTTRVLVVNFQAIHTSSQSLAFALFYLAANPQCIRSLREEVEDIVGKEGWTRTSVGKMRKIDSFLRECQRMETVNFVTLQRKAMKDFTLSDGTFIPKGTTIAAASRSIHFDETVYKNARTFEPFRFAHLGDDNDDEGVKHQFVSISADYLAFGHGRQACPGRFFAAAELKTMLAHVVMSYDLRLEGGAIRPPVLGFSTANLFDPHMRVMFRKKID